MDLKKNDHYLNYLLNVFFVLLIVVFIALIVLISRVVFSGSGVLSEHVKSTQDLFENVDNFQNLTLTSNKCLSSISVQDFDLNFNSEFKILDSSYRNFNENKSVLTVFINSKIGFNNELYYVEIKNFSNIHKFERLVYLNEGSELANSGLYIGYENSKIMLESLDNELIKLDTNQILGRFIFKNG